MNTKDYAISVFDSLTEEQLLDFIKIFADDNTLALVESEIILIENIIAVSVKF